MNGVSDSEAPRRLAQVVAYFSFILYFFVLSGPLKPEVEEEVAEHELCLSLGHFSPPLFSPQEANAVRRATPQSAHSPS